MSPDSWIALSALGFTLLGSILAMTIWFIRLEGRVAAVRSEAHALITANAKAIETISATTNTAIAALQARANGHDETKVEVVRLQEQIKHLTELIEKWLQPIQPRPRRATKATD